MKKASIVDMSTTIGLFWNICIALLARKIPQKDIVKNAKKVFVGESLILTN